MDGQGTVWAETDGTGTATGSAAYDPWGTPRGSATTATGSGWTGLTYLRSRDYAPGPGRFTSRDTVSPNAPGTQGYTPYAYAAGNPVTHTDPGGRSVGVVESFKVAATPMLDAGRIILPLVSAPWPVRALMEPFNVLPPAAKVVALLAPVGSGASVVGAGMVLVSFLSIFAKAAKVIRACTTPGAQGRACRALGTVLPRLPCVLAVGLGLLALQAQGIDGEEAGLAAGGAVAECLNLPGRGPDGPDGLRDEAFQPQSKA